MKIKIVEIMTDSQSDDNYYSSFSYFVGATDWAEISESDYNYLIRYLDKRRYVIVRDMDVAEILTTVENCVNKAKEFVRVEKEKEAKKTAAAKLRAKKLKEKKEQKDKEKLLQLAEKLGVLDKLTKE